MTMGRETYLPDPGDQVARVHAFLAAHQPEGRDRPEHRILLSTTEHGDQVELPHELARVLLQVVEAMRANLAVTVVPQTQTLTSQQAADLLGLSRPTVIKLLEEGRIPFERVGTHRRILLRDLLAYREIRRAEQYESIAAMSDGFDEDEGVATVLKELKEIRRVVAEQRRRGSTN